jgi:hypothetical protein
MESMDTHQEVVYDYAVFITMNFLGQQHSYLFYTLHDGPKLVYDTCQGSELLSVCIERALHGLKTFAKIGISEQGIMLCATYTKDEELEGILTREDMKYLDANFHVEYKHLEERKEDYDQVKEEMDEIKKNGYITYWKLETDVEMLERKLEDLEEEYNQYMGEGNRVVAREVEEEIILIQNNRGYEYQVQTYDDKMVDNRLEFLENELLRLYSPYFASM